VAFWDRWLGRKSLTTSLELFRELYGGRLAKSGIAVNWKTALDVTTVLACARVIAEGLAQVPLKLFRVSADGRTRLPADDHPLYRRASPPAEPVADVVRVPRDDRAAPGPDGQRVQLHQSAARAHHGADPAAAAVGQRSSATAPGTSRRTR
jgi:hypothetical protein